MHCRTLTQTEHKNVALKQSKLSWFVIAAFICSSALETEQEFWPGRTFHFPRYVRLKFERKDKRTLFMSFGLEPSFVSFQILDMYRVSPHDPQI